MKSLKEDLRNSKSNDKMWRAELKAVFLFISMAYIFFIMGCADEYEGKRHVTAEFMTYSELHYYDKVNGKSLLQFKKISEDTFMINSTITFEALDSTAESYEWQIGTDPIKRTDRKFSLTFYSRSIPPSNLIRVKLKIKRSPDTKYFPEDKGMDSVTRTVYFLESDSWPLYGKYIGSDNVDPQNKFSIEIVKGKWQGLAIDSIKHLPSDCPNMEADIVSATAFEFAIGEQNLSEINGMPECFFNSYDRKTGYLKADRKTIVVDYSFTKKGSSGSNVTKRTFTGIKQ